MIWRKACSCRGNGHQPRDEASFMLATKCDMLKVVCANDDALLTTASCGEILGPIYLSMR